MDQLFSLLKQTPDGSFFNPWYDRDPDNDRSSEAPAIRKRQLRAYIRERIGRARYLCIAEALGYQGGHFTGIAMTSERILLGHHESVHGIPSDGAFRNIKPRRTSKVSVREKGMSEPTATIVWKALYRMGMDPYEVVLWNALAWHPFDPEQGLLSNRTPTDDELRAGAAALRCFLELFPDGEIVAVGKKAEHSLEQLGIGYLPVRHPANGGAAKFRRQFSEIVNKRST